MRLLILFLAAILLFAGCSKTTYDASKPYGGLSFYNASYMLDAYLPTAYGRQVWLPLTPGTKQPAALNGTVIPGFFSGISGAGWDYPAVNTTNNFPWMVFDYFTPGTYAAGLHLASTDSASLFNFPVSVQLNKQQTCFIADSLGIYSATTVVHEPANTTDKIRLRLLQFCPDADSVNLRIGNNLVNGVQNMGYRSVSAYIDYPLATDSTLKLRIFNAGDTLNVMARTDLQAQPGQSYTLILRHYRKSHQYKDAEGKTVNILPGNILDVRRTE